MRKFIRTNLIPKYYHVVMKTFLSVALLAVATAAAQDRHVIVISLDGFRAMALRDPNVPLPVIRRMEKEGAIAEGMRTVNPTVTWPNHTSIISGVSPAEHGVLYNGLIVRNGEGKSLRIEPWVDKKELVLAPTVADVARDAGLTTAEVDWVAIYPTSSVTWSFPERPQPDQTEVRDVIAAGVVTAEEIANWTRTAITHHDDVWTRAAVHIIEKHKPNLLLLHLLTTDSVQHANGPASLAGNTALILADRQIERVMAAVDRAGIRDSTSIIVVSDHGFRQYQKVVHANTVLKQKGLLRSADDCDAWAIAEGGTAMVYITRESKRAETAKVLQDAFAGVPGVARVIRPSEFEAMGYPKWTLGGRMADLVLAAEPGYSFDNATPAEVTSDVPGNAIRGSHGYLNSDPELNAILVAWGAGIQPGARLGVVPNVNVAPTIARLLGLKWPAGKGEVLEELLRK
jgi:predicted AlkP superfamily pyrophosphatase or phosphodiesterase